MAEYIIQPWGDVEGDVPTVPPELDALAVQVMSRYDMTVSGMQLITTKPDKGGAIWRIETNHGPRSLKVLHRTPARSLFSVGAQEYLVKQGAKVPPLVPCKQGDLYVEAGGKLWIVTDWIEPLTPASKIDLEGAQALCYGLGEFHRLSKGYVPPEGAEFSSRLHNYPKSYQKIIDKMDWFRHLAELYIDLPAAPRILSMVDKYQQQARDALAALEASPYYELTARGEQAWGFAHQDYGWSNGQLGPGGLWIIDLDGVSFDLPIRDLRKLITGTMSDMGVWDVTWMKGMIEAYHQANPIEPDLYQVLLVDFMLPNEFYKNVKEMVYTPDLFLNAETDAMVERIDMVDATKWAALKELGATDIRTYENNYSLNIDALRRNVNPSRWNTDVYAPGQKLGAGSGIGGAGKTGRTKGRSSLRTGKVPARSGTSNVSGIGSKSNRLRKSTASTSTSSSTGTSSVRTSKKSSSASLTVLHVATSISSHKQTSRSPSSTTIRVRIRVNENKGKGRKKK